MLIAKRVLAYLVSLTLLLATTLWGEDKHVQDGGDAAADLQSVVDRSFTARDTLEIGDEPNSDASDCLDGLRWQPTRFEANCEASRGDQRVDLIVRFPSPVVSGDARNDRVAMEWYVARDDQGRPMRARAIVVIHESGSAMTVGRVIARGLREHGLHTFMLQLPYYGLRRTGRKRPADMNFMTAMRQSIADVRRARDAVAVLPWVDSTHIALQGTSLGGFVSATAASLDFGYDSVYLMLAGGELYDLIQNGEKDSAKVREELAKAGLVCEQLKSLARTIEPTRVAHRLDPQRTWLYSGSFDTVVPPRNARALAKSAGLDQEHHVRMLANHYTGIMFLPYVLDQIQQQVKTLDRD